MNSTVIYPEALKRIKAIHALSLQINGQGGGHTRKLLSLMRKHIDEIEELMKSGNTHALTETGDLAILCFELLLEYDRSLDATLSQCFARYEKKLAELQ